MNLVCLSTHPILLNFTDTIYFLSIISISFILDTIWLYVEWSLHYKQRSNLKEFGFLFIFFESNPQQFLMRFFQFIVNTAFESEFPPKNLKKKKSPWHFVRMKMKKIINYFEINMQKTTKMGLNTKTNGFGIKYLYI